MKIIEKSGSGKRIGIVKTNHLEVKMREEGILELG
jgi:hypothetical protein